jgi:hypothetical protein
MRSKVSLTPRPGGDGVDLVYVMAALIVPAATVLGLRVWFGRRPDVPPRPVADLDSSELAQTLAALQERLKELGDQVETMNRDGEERDQRLTGRLNSLLAMTERPTRFDLSVGHPPGAPGRPARPGPSGKPAEPARPATPGAGGSPRP